MKRGHEVQVVTGYPNYPEGVIYNGYGRNKRINEIIHGVKVHRCFTIPRKTGSIYRFLNYYSYALSSSAYIRKCKANDGTPFDVVFVNQLSPVMMGYAAIKYSKKYHVPSVMYCLDLWPESLTAGGIKRTSVIYKIFHRISKHIYKKMDRILVTSRMFTEYLEKEFGIPKEGINYLPQYAEDIFTCLPGKKTTDTIDLVFAGNIGTIQSVDTIIKAAEILKEEKVKFHIIGGGVELESLKTLAREKQLTNVIFYGRRPLEEMPGFYQKADAMLITLKADPVLSLTLPGKVQSYMAAGKPIIGSIDGEASTIIKEAECGYCGKAEDEEELAQNILRFIKMRNSEKNKIGNNARKFYENYFEEQLFMGKLEKTLLMALGRKEDEHTCI